jgi:hypothetical protein
MRELGVENDGILKKQQPRVRNRTFTPMKKLSLFFLGFFLFHVGSAWALKLCLLQGTRANHLHMSDKAPHEDHHFPGRAGAIDHCADIEDHIGPTTRSSQPEILFLLGGAVIKHVSLQESSALFAKGRLREREGLSELALSFKKKLSPHLFFSVLRI